MSMMPAQLRNSRGLQALTHNSHCTQRERGRGQPGGASEEDLGGVEGVERQACSVHCSDGSCQLHRVVPEQLLLEGQGPATHTQVPGVEGLCPWQVVVHKHHSCRERERETN